MSYILYTDPLITYLSGRGKVRGVNVIYVTLYNHSTDVYINAINWLAPLFIF